MPDERHSIESLPTSRRIVELDGIRGCAVLLVMIWHYIPCQLPAAAPGTLARFLKRALFLTWSGVDLFFVLSGFLITGILLRNRGAANYLRVFYVRRVCRIFPPYFLLLLLYIVVCFSALAGREAFRWLLHDPMPLWSYATFTQNVVMGLRETAGAHWLGVTWSLGVEEQFYLLLPALVLVAPRRMLPYLVVAAVVTAPVLRFWRSDLLAFVSLPWRADSLLIGSLLALVVGSPRAMAIIRGNLGVLYSVFGLLLAGAAAMTYRFVWFGPLAHTWLAALYAVFILVPLAHERSPIALLLRWPPLVWCGLLSYSIYLYHQVTSGILHALFRGEAPAIIAAEDAILTGCAFILTMIVAALSFVLLERPIVRLGHRYRYRYAAPPEITA